jgi:predicted nucleotidyltransferase component of viral defense system
LAFRGGTALHKLHFQPARRYSEDIDLVQIEAGGIGPVIDKIQGILGEFLGKPRRNQSEEAVTLIYRMETDGSPVISMRMKVEINTREHFSVEGFQKKPFALNSRWFQGDCEITTYSLEELLGTKVRALYQRRKGRDLIDIWLGLTEGKANADRVVDIFKRYMNFEENIVDSKTYEKNLRDKMKHPGFASDIEALLPDGASYDLQAAFDYVVREIVSRIDLS